jgi:hypothetical protein
MKEVLPLLLYDFKGSVVSVLFAYMETNLVKHRCSLS